MNKDGPNDSLYGTLVKHDQSETKHDKVRVGAYADDQRIGSKDGLNEVHLTPNIVVRGDEGDVLIASVVNETGQRLIGPRTTARSG
jgi:hypothetical protein